MAVELRRDVGGWMVRWNSQIAARALACGDWPDRTVAQFAAERAAAHPHRVQIIDGEFELSCGELYQRAQRLAGYFLSIGLQMGDVVSFQLPNWWEATVINLAAAMTGVVVNPIVPINRDAEVTYMLNASRSRAMFVPGVFRKFDYLAMMRRIAPALARPPRVIGVRATAGATAGTAAARRPATGAAGEAAEREAAPAGAGHETFDSTLDAAAALTAPLEVNPNAVKLLMYTSGTTGRPKGVLHSHNSIHADSIKMRPLTVPSSEDVIFCPSPVTHVSGYLWVLNMPWVGDVTAVMMDIWDPQRAYELVSRHRASFIVGATPFLQDLVAIAKQAARPLDHLKSFMCGGAAVPPNLIYEAAQVFPQCIPWRTFGATEAPTLTAPPPSRESLRRAAETDGRLYRSEAKVVSIADGAPVPAGSEGEILVREPSMALGYALPEDNEGAYDEEGYFRMGDLVRIVETDHVLCTGRKKDLIIRAGENISPKEIEDVMYRSPKVLEAAVVAMPSVKTGEAICAFIVPQPGASLDLAEIAGWVAAAGLARQKTPEQVRIIGEMPKNPAGKIRKDQLRLMALQSQPAALDPWAPGRVALTGSVALTEPAASLQMSPEIKT